MQDVLRKMYTRKHRQIQQRRMDRELGLPQNRRFRNRRKDLWQDYRPLLEDFSLEKQYQEQQKLLFGNNFIRSSHRWRVEVPPNPTELILPRIKGVKTQRELAQENDGEFRLIEDGPVKPKRIQKQLMRENHYKRLRLIFRAAVHSVVFLSRLRDKRKQTLLKKRKRTLQRCEQLPVMIEKMVAKYYSTFLEEQLLKYLELIKMKIQSPETALETEVISMLYFMSKRLTESSIIKELLSLLSTISSETAFFPSDFLTEVEAYRLQFNTRYGFIQNVTYEQSRMIIGVFVGVKLFALSVLYKPWLLEIKRSPIEGEQIVKNYEVVKKMICAAGSVFYYMVLQSFCEVVELTPNLKSGTFRKLGYVFSSISVFPETYKVRLVEKPTEIFANQSKKIYLLLMKEYREMFEEMRENITTWLDRIVIVCQKESEKNKREEKQEQTKLQKARLEAFLKPTGKRKVESGHRKRNYSEKSSR